MASYCARMCLLYFSLSVTLVILAISLAGHLISSHKSDQDSIFFSGEVSVDASNALRRAGYNTMANLFQRSPPFFLPPQNSTLFAIKDSAFKNITLSPTLLTKILQFHTSTSMASMKDLLKKSQGSCLPTLFRHKKVAITRIDPSERLVEINHVLISKPDLYLGNRFAIHGVVAPFSPVDFQEHLMGLNSVRSASCPSNSGQFSEPFQSKNSVIRWKRLVRSLSSKGYAPFSIGLYTVLDMIRRESKYYDSFTILAPPDFDLHGRPTSLIGKAVRLHILPKRLTYRELTSLPIGTLLKTLKFDKYIEIEQVPCPGFMSLLVIDGVEIVAPDVSVSDKFVVHGISEALKIDELITT